MAGQTIETTITVDAKQAQAELERLKANVSAAESAIVKAGAAMPALEKNTMSAGARMLTLGQFVDDVQYGLRGVVNNMPQVVQAFGGGLGLAGGIGIAAVAVSQLYDAYKAYDAIQKEVAENSKIWMSALDSTNKVLREGSLKSTNELIKSLKDAQEEVKNFGKTANEIRIMTAEEGLAAKEKSLSILEKNLPGLEQRARPQGRRQLTFLQQVGIEEVFSEQEKEDFKAQVQVFENAKKRRGEIVTEIQREKAALEELRKTAEKMTELEKKKAEEERKKSARLAGADRRRKEIEDEAKQDADMRRKWVEQLYDDDDRLAAEAAERRKKDAEEAAKMMADEFEEMDKARERARKEAEKDAERQRKAEEKHLSRLHDLRGESTAQRLAFNDIATEYEMRNLDRLADHEWKTLKDRIKSQSEFYDQIGGMATKATEMAISLGQEYVDAKIEGAENAEAEVAAKALKGIGDQLVGIGTKNLIEGTGMTILGDPRGPALIGLGSVAIATGIGFGAGGTAVAHTAGGNKIGQAASREDRMGARERGASPRSSRGGEGGGFVVNVSYGVAGPLPEDTAREIHRALKTGGRRAGA